MIVRIVDKAMFKERVRGWADKLDARVSSISVRPMTTRWASYSTTGRLTLRRRSLAGARGTSGLRHCPRAASLPRAEPRQAMEEPHAGALRQVRAGGSQVA